MARRSVLRETGCGPAREKLVVMILFGTASSYQYRTNAAAHNRPGLSSRINPLSNQAIEPEEAS
jgi:hypothetical protein